MRFGLRVSAGEQNLFFVGKMLFNKLINVFDPERQLSFAYTHNFPTTSIAGDYRLWGLTQETLRCADATLNGRKGWF